MPITPKVWENLPSTDTPLSAAALVDLETRLMGQSVSPRFFDGDPTGTTDSTSAIASAISLAESRGTALLLDGMFKCSSSLTINGIDIQAGGRGCGITWSSDLGSGNSGLVVEDTTGSGNALVINGAFIGPGTGYTPGVSPAAMGGVEIVGNAKGFLSNGTTQGFRSGVIWGNAVGHITLNHWNSTGNFYGIYCTQLSSDYFVIDSLINGNSRANLACPATVGMSALQVIRSHWGLAPFGFLMESGDIGDTFTPFMSDCILNQCRLEGMGNGVIVSLADFNSGSKANTGGLRLIDSGSNFYSGAYDSSMTTEYIFDLGVITGLITLEQTIIGPYVANHVAGEMGSSGVLRAQEGGGTLVVPAESQYLFYDSMLIPSAIPSGDIDVVTGALSIMQGTIPFYQGNILQALEVAITGTTDSVLAMGTPVGEIDFFSSSRRLYADAGSVNLDSDGQINLRDASNSYADVLSIVAKGSNPSARATFSVIPSVPSPNVVAPSVGAHWTIYFAPKYWQDLQGQVTITGLVYNNTSVAAGDVIFALPLGMAPAEDILVGGLSIIIDTVGNIKSNASLSIDTYCVLNVTFLAGA